MPNDGIHTEFTRYCELLERFSADYRSDSELKARIDGGDVSPAVEALGLEDLQREVELRVVSNSPEVLHVVMPPPEEQAVPDTMLETVVGGTGAADAATTMAAVLIGWPFLLAAYARLQQPS